MLRIWKYIYHISEVGTGNKNSTIFSLFESENYFSWVKNYHKAGASQAENNKQEGEENLLAGTPAQNKYLIALSQFQASPHAFFPFLLLIMCGVFLSFSFRFI